MPLLRERHVRKLRDARDVDALVELLSHRDEATRSQAAASLGSLKDQQALPALAQELPNVPAAAAAIRDIVTAQPVIASSEPQVTEVVAHSLAMFLLEPHWQRDAALEALRRLGALQVVPTLLAAVATTPRGLLAAQALCDLSDPRERGGFFRSDRRAFAQSGGLRLRSVDVYWRIFNVAVAAHEQAPRSAIVSELGEWLCHVLIPTTIPELLDHARGADASRRELARRVLAQDGWDRRRREQIGALLDAADPAARRLGAKSLGGAGGEAARRRLLDASHDDDETVREETLDALAQLGPHPDTTTRMLEALTDPAWRVRSDAVLYFSAHPDPRAVPWLIAMLAEAGRHPWSLASALAASRDRRAIPALRALVHRRGADAPERADAIRALAKLGDRESVSHFRRLLSDREPAIRDAAASALQALGEGDQTGRYGPDAWRWQIKLAMAAGLVAALPLALFWVLPLSSDSWSENGIDWFGGTFLIAVAAAAAFGGYAAVRDHRRVLRAPRWVQLPIALLAVPTVLGLAGFALKPMHDRHARAARVFDAYTHRFPEGRLGAKFIDLDEDGQTNMCASERRNTAFCVAVDHSAAPGRQAIGGYRLDYDASDEFGPAITDCFGDLGCSDDQTSDFPP
jgi:HEAT repeat protein